MCLGESRVDSQRFLQLLDFPRAVGFLVVGLAEVEPSTGEIGVQSKRGFQFADRLVGIDHDQHPAEVSSGIRVVGLESNGCSERGYGFFGLVGLCQDQAEIVVRFGVLWV